MHHDWRVAPARHNQRKPAHTNEDPAQSKINKSNEYNGNLKKRMNEHERFRIQDRTP